MGLSASELKERIDRLGELRKALHVMGDEEKAVAADVRAALEKRTSLSAAGARYRAELVPSATTEIADAAGIQKAAGKRFLEIVRIQVTQARRVLGAAVLDRFCRQVPGHKLTVHPVGA